MLYIYPVSPETLAGILNGNITALVVKRVPKAILDGTDTEVFLYCNEKGGTLWNVVYGGGFEWSGDWKKGCHPNVNDLPLVLNGLVPCKFTVKSPHQFGFDWKNEDSQETRYTIPFWQLDIFENPMELNEFYKEEYAMTANGTWMPASQPLSRAPRGFQRVEVGK